MEDKQPIEVGTNPKTGFQVHRVYEVVSINRRSQFIKVLYLQWELNLVDEKVFEVEKSYIVRNIAIGEIINNYKKPPFIPSVENPLIQIPNPELTAMQVAYNGFDNWYDYETGNLKMGICIEGAIDQTLTGLPIDAPDGWIITQSN
jgi:hypothetical protein